MINKPISELKNLIGVSSVKELAAMLNESENTLRNINIDRRNKSAYKAYVLLVEAFKRLSPSDMNDIAQMLSRPLALSGKEQEDRLRDLESRLAQHPDTVENDMHKAYESFRQYFADLKEYKRLRS